MEMATKERVPAFCAMWKRALRTLVANQPDPDDGMTEEDRRELCVSSSELRDQEFGIPPHRSGGWL